MSALLVGLAITFGLVLTRISAFVFVSPFPGSQVPAQARIGLALVLAFAIAPAVGTSSAKLGPELALAVMGEAATGAVIGLLFRVGTSVAEIVGATYAQALGITMASSYDPAAGANVDPLTRLFTAIAGVVALSLGAHRIVLASVLASFHAVPLGGWLELEAAGPTTLRWFASSLDCGLRLALPAATVTVAIHLALGLATRAAPALQSFGFALPLTVVSGALVIIESANDVCAGIGTHLSNLMSVIESALAHGS